MAYVDGVRNPPFGSAVAPLTRAFFLAGGLVGASAGAWLLGRIADVRMRGWIEVELGIGALCILPVGIVRLRALRRRLDRDPTQD